MSRHQMLSCPNAGCGISEAWTAAATATCLGQTLQKALQLTDALISLARPRLPQAECKAAAFASGAFIITLHQAAFLLLFSPLLSSLSEAATCPTSLSASPLPFSA